MSQASPSPWQRLSERAREGGADLAALLDEAWHLVEAAPPGRALATAAISFVAELPSDLPARQALPLLLRAAHLFEDDPASTPGELVIAWHNVAVAANGAGDTAQASQGWTGMVRTAALRPGALGGQATMLLLRLAESCREQRQSGPLLVIERRLRDELLHDGGLADDTLAAWLGRHGQTVLQAGLPEDRDVGFMAAAADLLAVQGDRPLAWVASCSMHAAMLEAHRRWDETAVVLDRALAPTIVQGRDRIALLMRSARAWWHTGGFDRSSERSLEALSLRLRLAQRRES